MLLALHNNDESPEQMRQRRIKETKELIEGWFRELSYAIEKADRQHVRYCEMCILIESNTLRKLSNFEMC